MELRTQLSALEQKFYNELGENKDLILEVLKKMYNNFKENDQETLKVFKAIIPDFFGGVYIPFIFWEELAEFYNNNDENRESLNKIIEQFASSNFEESETRKMRQLLIAYFAVESRFQVDKMIHTIVHNAHPDIQKYFEKIIDFIDTKPNAVGMYQEKFSLIAERYPDFDLLRLPLAKLKAQLQKQ